MQRKITQEEKDGMIGLYNQGYSATKSAAQYGLSSECCSREAKKRGIPIRDNSKYKIDNTIFESIDTEEKAYWLGFLAADGTVTEEGIIILSLKNEDFGHVQKFLNFCKSSHPIKIYNVKISKDSDKTYKSCKVVIGNRKITNDLIPLGVSPRKTFSFVPPLNIIPKELQKHFWRGIFDGDGCISKTYDTKNQENCIWVSNLTGNQFVVSEFKKFVSSYSNAKANMLLKYDSDAGKTYGISFAGVELVQMILYGLYHNSTISLDRKYQLYLECMNQIPKKRNRQNLSETDINLLFAKHKIWRGVAKELGTSTGRLFLIRKNLGMIRSSQNRKKKEKETTE